jgi:hemerythrin superfamily protein
MNKPLHQFFTEDHHHIEELLNKAIEQPGEIKMNYYHQFRTRLLRHIKMEEKTLFPAAKKAGLELMQQLIPRYRLDHGALTALLVPPPTPSLVKVIRYILEKHDLAEEEPGGLYDICEALTHGKTQELLEQLAGTEEVPVHPPNPAPIAMESARRALERAGYDLDKIMSSTNER